MFSYYFKNLRQEGVPNFSSYAADCEEHLNIFTVDFCLAVYYCMKLWSFRV